MSLYIQGGKASTVIIFEFFYYFLDFFDDNEGFTRPAMFLCFHAFFEVFHYFLKICI